MNEINFSQLRSLVNEDWHSHDKDWTRPGFRAIAWYRFGNWRMGIKNKFIRAPFSVLYRIVFRYIRNHYGVEVPYSATIGRRVIIEHQGNIVIHGDAVIGDDCIIRQGVTIGNRHLDKPHDAPRFGNNVNIGVGAVILGGITIGDNVAIGANAVVLQDIPENSLAVGIPAAITPLND